MIAELIRNALEEHNAHERLETVLAGTVTLIYRAASGRVRQSLAVVQRLHFGAHFLPAHLPRGRSIDRGAAGPGNCAAVAKAL
jgi:metal-responsive CopG/Arc/MetJ family transcriptional regulator